MTDEVTLMISTVGNETIYGLVIHFYLGAILEVLYSHWIWVVRLLFEQILINTIVFTIKLTFSSIW